MNATPDGSIAKPSRRAFIQGAAGGFLLAFHLPVFGSINESNTPAGDTSGKFAPNAFIRIDKAGKGRGDDDAWRTLERLVVAVADPRANRLLAG